MVYRKTATPDRSTGRASANAAARVTTLPEERASSTARSSPSSSEPSPAPTTSAPPPPPSSLSPSSEPPPSCPGGHRLSSVQPDCAATHAVFFETLTACEQQEACRRNWGDYSISDDVVQGSFKLCTV